MVVCSSGANRDVCSRVRGHIVKIRITVTGLCAFVAQDWKTGQGNAAVGDTEVLLLEPAKSTLASESPPPCDHHPYLLFPEFDVNHYLEGIDGSSGKKFLQSIVDPKNPAVVFGMLPLEGRSLKFSWLDSNKNEVLPIPGGLSKDGSFDRVLSLDELAVAGSFPRINVDPIWLNRGKVGGVVAARFAMDRGTLSTPPGLTGTSIYTANNPAASVPFEFAQSIFWDVPVFSNGIQKLQVKAFTGATLTEELLFGLGGPDTAVPTFLIVNLCGAEFPLPKVGREVAAYYDLAVNPPPLTSRPSLNELLVATAQPVKSGSGFCAPNRAVW